MKKLFVTAVVCAIAIVPAISAEMVNSTSNVQNTRPKYELGQYNFNLKGDESTLQSTVPVKEITEVKAASIPAVAPQTPVSSTKKLTPQTHKSIIEQVKKEEAALKNSTKADTAVVEQKVKEGVNATEQEFDKIKTKTESAIKEGAKASENKLDKVKTETENAIKEGSKATEQTLDKTKIKTKNLLNKSQKMDSSKNNKPVKFDSSKPPFQFKIMEIPTQGTTTRTIERL